MAKQSELMAKRRERIISAALRVFLASGFRRTSMEAIAKEAGVAKPTLYGYFSDKELVFKAVVGKIVNQMKLEFENKLSAEDQPSQRIASALASKYDVMNNTFGDSPHKVELYSEHGILCAGEVLEFKQWLVDNITAVLTEAGFKKPVFLASVILAAINGLDMTSSETDSFEEATHFIVCKLLS